MATLSSILAWRIPRTEGPCGLQPTGSQRVRRDLAIKQQLANRVSGDQDHKDSFYNTLLLIQVGVFSKIREIVIKVEINIWVKYLEMCQ